MLVKSIVSLLAIAGLATAQTNYSKGVATGVKDGINATFTFDKVSNGVNITVTVYSGLNMTFASNATLGFDYHVHEKPVGPGGNCSATGAHLDPYKVGVATPCNPQNLTSCQTGDLAGKYGNLKPTDTGAIPTIAYLDTQLDFSEIGLLGRSVVIHNNKARVWCADLVVDGYTPPPANTSNTQNTTNPPGNSATKLIGSVALSGVVAAIMLVL